MIGWEFRSGLHEAIQKSDMHTNPLPPTPIRDPQQCMRKTFSAAFVPQSAEITLNSYFEEFKDFFKETLLRAKIVRHIDGVYSGSEIAKF